MKRVVLSLGVILLACVLASASVYYIRTRQPPAEWMGKRLGLEGAALTEFTSAHNQYAISCAEMCRRIEQANNELAGEIVSSREFTPAISNALVRTEALRAECKEKMLKHFFGVAKLLDSDKQEEYIHMVLPLITEQTQMQQAHHH